MKKSKRYITYGFILGAILLLSNIGIIDAARTTVESWVRDDTGYVIPRTATDNIGASAVRVPRRAVWSGGVEALRRHGRRLRGQDRTGCPEVQRYFVHVLLQHGGHSVSLFGEGRCRSSTGDFPCA